MNIFLEIEHWGSEQCNIWCKTWTKYI